jgi:hypothetical protein
LLQWLLQPCYKVVFSIWVLIIVLLCTKLGPVVISYVF